MVVAAAATTTAMTAVDIPVERRIKAGILRAVVSTVIMVVVVIVTVVTVVTTTATATITATVIVTTAIIVITMIIIVKVAEIIGKVKSAMNMGKGSTATNLVSMVVSTGLWPILLRAMVIRPMRDTVRAAAAAAVGATEKITNAKGMDQADINARSRIVS